MSNQMFSYNPTYGGANLYASKSAAAPAAPTITDPYFADSSLISSKYRSSDLVNSDPSLYSMTDRVSSMYLNKGEALRHSSATSAGSGVDASSAYWTAAAMGSQAAWPVPHVGASIDPAAALKRSTEALYHQSLLDSQNTVGQTEAYYLVKRPRFESASNLPIYPQRPGQRDCAHYMLTRTCMFGDSCKFDHPVWVPDGGIPDWKEVSIVTPSEPLPERSGEPDCPYFVKTQKCKFGSRCRFNHPKEVLVTAENASVGLPERPYEPPCAFYMKTGICKFGATCKFNHPKDIQVSVDGQENGSTHQAANETSNMNIPNTAICTIPALMHNSKGLPVRLGEVDCPFYMKMGSCKYGATCRYNHPERYAPTMLVSPASANMAQLQTTDPRMLGFAPAIYPQRPGQTECDFYMKTGECKFGETCRFHHPIDRSAPTQMMMSQALEHVKLSLAGLPRREGAVKCPFYMKTGTCSFGATCRFDHPPPGEVMVAIEEEKIGQ